MWIALMFAWNRHRFSSFEYKRFFQRYFKRTVCEHAIQNSCLLRTLPLIQLSSMLLRLWSKCWPFIRAQHYSIFIIKVLRKCTSEEWIAMRHKIKMQRPSTDTENGVRHITSFLSGKYICTCRLAAVFRNLCVIFIWHVSVLLIQREHIF